MRTLSFIALTLVLLTGCSSNNQDGTAVAEDPAVAELEAWAGDLCGATGELRAAVTGLADAIDFDLAAGLGQIPGIYEQLQGRIERVESGIAEFQTALEQAPASSPEAVAFAAEVQTLSSSARASADEALLLAEQAVTAGNFLSAGSALAAAASAAQSAYTDANAALVLVEQASNAESGAMGAVFANAPECRFSQ